MYELRNRFTNIKIPTKINELFTIHILLIILNFLFNNILLSTAAPFSYVTLLIIAMLIARPDIKPVQLSQSHPYLVLNSDNHRLIRSMCTHLLRNIARG